MSFAFILYCATTFATVTGYELTRLYIERFLIEYLPVVETTLAQGFALVPFRWPKALECDDITHDGSLVLILI